MAAAEYYTGGPLHTQAASSPYQRPQNSQHTSAPIPMNIPEGSYGQYPPPPYQAMPNEAKPSVHFANSPRPSQQQLGSPYASQAPMPVPQPHRPSVSSQHSSASQQYSPHFTPQPNSYHGTPPQSNFLAPGTHYPLHQRPYLNGTQSMQSLNHGYASDPERHRRRHRRHEHRDERDINDRPSKDRSRSTNADGFLGAAGGGLIGDMIFPGLGTVGGALAGWIGGKDYGKHRKSREGQRDKEQHIWERKHRSRSNSDDRRDESRARRSYERHKSEY